MDSTDAAILNELKNNARIANLDLAKKVHLSPSAVLERVRRLRANGIIRGFQTKFDSVKLGLGLTVLIELRIAQNIGADGGIREQRNARGPAGAHRAHPRHPFEPDHAHHFDA